MHRIEPARLKPGATQDTLPGPRPSDAAVGSTRAGDPRQGAHLLGPEGPRQEARRDRHRPDHAGRRLRLREPRDARRAVEGGLLPPPHARLPRARAPRREFPDRGRAVRHRVLARDEPGGIEGRGRGKGPRARRRLQPRHGRHLPAQRLQPRAARRAVPGGRRGRAGRRRVLLRPRDARPHQRDAGQDATRPFPCRPRRRRSARAAASSPSAGASSATRSGPLPRCGGRSPSSRGA